MIGTTNDTSRENRIRRLGATFREMARFLENFPQAAQECEWLIDSLDGVATMAHFTLYECVELFQSMSDSGELKFSHAKSDAKQPTPGNFAGSH